MKIKQHKPKGFTIVELIVVIMIFAVIFSSTSVVLGNIIGQKSVQSKGQEIVQDIREIRMKSVSQKEDSKWGIYLNTSSAPDSYIVFKGNSYAGRDVNYDIEFELPKAVSFSSINIVGGNEIVFENRSGYTSNAGSFSLVTEDDSFDISINKFGLIDYFN